MMGLAKLLTSVSTHSSSKVSFSSFLVFDSLFLIRDSNCRSIFFCLLWIRRCGMIVKVGTMILLLRNLDMHFHEFKICHLDVIRD